MIDQAIVDRILDVAQIVGVVPDFIALRERSVNYAGLCFFHNEKAPSFDVPPSKGLYKCFSYGRGGDAVYFIMEHEQISYPEALYYLAEKYNIEIKEREPTNEEREIQGSRESMFTVNNFTRNYFQNILKNHVDGRNIGLAYSRQRGFRDDIIDGFQLGLSAEGYGTLAQEAMRKGFKKEFLVETGFCYGIDDYKLHDRFWGHIIFPVHTLSGKVVALGGRVLGMENGKPAKYVNSPGSETYHKSNELYGIYFAKQAIIKQNRCFLMGGYTGMISMHQSGVKNVVAPFGAFLVPGQIRLIHHFTNSITVLYDGDMAGTEASIRDIDMLLEGGMNIKICLLPDGDDPSSFVRRHNITKFQSFIQEHETDFIRFKAQLLMEDAGKDPMKRAELIDDIIHGIAVVPEAIVRDVYIKECGQLLWIEDELLVSEVAKRHELQTEKGNKPAATNHVPVSEAGEIPPPFPPEEAEIDTYQSFIPQKGKEGQKFYKYERLIIQMITRYGEGVMYNMTDEEGNEVPVTMVEYVIDDLKEDELASHNPLHRRIFSRAAKHVHEQEFAPERFFVVHPDPAISTVAAGLASDRYQLSEYHSETQKLVTDEERLYKMVPMLMINFKNVIVTEGLKHIMYALQDPAITNDSAQCGVVMQRYKEVKEIQNLIAKRLGDRVVLH